MAEFLVRLGGAGGRPTEEAVVRAHVDWLFGLHEAGVLRFCGPCDDGSAIIVLSCPTLEDAERLAGEDPFALAQVYTARSVVRLRLATPENDFLLRLEGGATVARGCRLLGRSEKGSDFDATTGRRSNQDAEGRRVPQTGSPRTRAASAFRIGIRV